MDKRLFYLVPRAGRYGYSGVMRGGRDESFTMKGTKDTKLNISLFAPFVVKKQKKDAEMQD